MKRFGLETVPQGEIDRFWEYVNDHPECLNQKYVIRTLKKCGCKVIPDPFSSKIVKYIAAKIKTKKPFSVIRIGDAEGNLLAYGAYHGTINLDKHVIAAYVQTRFELDDNAEISEIWFVILRELMMVSVLESDIIGCRNLSKTTQDIPDADHLYQDGQDNYHDYPRGSVGVFRSTDYILRLAASGRLSGKTIGNAHLYFSIVNHLDVLFRHVSDVLCITSRKEAVEKLQGHFPQIKFTWISSGLLIDPMRHRFHQQNMARFEPSFIADIEANLPDDLHGVLCLVGAGCWAEIYCTMIKRRGGGAIDIGSGFDLLAGEITRPIHRKLNLMGQGPGDALSERLSNISTRRKKWRWS